MCKMRTLLGSAAARFSGSHSSILLLALVLLLHGVILSQCGLGTTVAATRIHNREMELQRSLARYRQLLQHDDSRPDLVQPQESAFSPEQNSKKDVDVLQAVQEVELEVGNDDKAEVKENGNPNLETEEQQGDDETRVDDPNKDKDARKHEKKRKQKKAKDSDQSEKEQQDKTEELKLNTGERIGQHIPDEEKTEETNQGEELKVDNVGKAVEETEESQAVKFDKTKQESESNADHQQQGEGRKEGDLATTEQETESIVENQQQDEEKVDPEAKAEEQQTEMEVEQSKTGENQSEEKEGSKSEIQVEQTEQSKDFESKIQVQKTEGWKESDSKSDEENTEDRQEQSESTTVEEKPAEEEPFIFPEPYLLGPTIKDWDEQRRSWLDANPQFKTTSDGKPRVLIVTGSQPDPCRYPTGDYFNVRSLKLKMDYARMHNYEIYYSFAWLDPLFGSYWVKLPLLRKLMLTHPEIEWFFWIDSDAVFTDMIFEAPFHTYEGINMIMWGYDKGFFVEKSWVAFNAGVFIIRNCQWSFDLIDKWSPMGPDGPVQVEYGKFLTAFLSNREENYPADDQSALAYLILTDEDIKSKVKLVDLTEYMVSAWWVEVVDTYEASMEKYHPGFGDKRWPWITHFTGCSPCGTYGTSPNHEKCMTSIERALNFADNQVLAYMGFQHESLSSQSLIRTRNESDRPFAFVGVNPWQERIAQVAAAAGQTMS